MDSSHNFKPLTDEERRRMSALLSTVSTRTLLNSLTNLYGENADACLIVAMLIDRLPPESPPLD